MKATSANTAGLAARAYSISTMLGPREARIQGTGSGTPAFIAIATTTSGTQEIKVSHQPNSGRTKANQATGSNQMRLIVNTATVTGR